MDHSLLRYLVAQYYTHSQFNMCLRFLKEEGLKFGGYMSSECDMQGGREGEGHDHVLVLFFTGCLI